MPPRRHPFSSTPNGWYQIAWVSKLSGRVDLEFYLNRRLIIFGPRHVVASGDCGCGADRWSWHVRGELGHLACDACGRAFDETGQALDEGTGLKVFVTAERLDGLFIFFHAEGAAPDFGLPTLDVSDRKRFSRRLIREYEIETHLQEIVENAVDTLHFGPVHKFAELPEISFHPEGRRARIRFSSRKFMIIAWYQNSWNLDYYGLSYAITEMDEPFGLYVVLAYTPIDDRKIKMRFQVILDRERFWLARNPLTRWPTEVITMLRTMQDFEPDIRIWESKRYAEKPVLCDQDGLAWPIRRWCQQFYTEPNRGLSQPDARWQLVGCSDDFVVGALKAVKVDGFELLLTREPSGRLRAFSAYCPHQGARLCPKNRLVKGAFECPFHRWRFDLAGTCVEAPNVGKIPPKAQLEAWTVEERNGEVRVRPETA